MNYPFVNSDGGRSSSKRPKQKNDCTVRAIALAENRDYDEVYNEVKAAGRECSRGFHFVEWAKKQPERFEYISFPAVKGEKRMNPVRFCKEYADGRYIIRTAKHVAAVVDGSLYDDYEMRNDRCIYGAFRIL